MRANFRETRGDFCRFVSNKINLSICRFCWRFTLNGNGFLRTKDMLLLRTFLCYFRIFLTNFLNKRNRRMFMNFGSNAIGLLKSKGCLLCIAGRFMMLIRITLILRFGQLRSMSDKRLSVESNVSFMGTRKDGVSALLHDEL